MCAVRVFWICMPIADRQFFHTVHVHICKEDSSDPIHASRHTDVMCLPLPVSLGDSWLTTASWSYQSGGTVQTRKQRQGRARDGRLAMHFNTTSLSEKNSIQACCRPGQDDRNRGAFWFLICCRGLDHRYYLLALTNPAARAGMDS
jgi:hypothetical protein